MNKNIKKEIDIEMIKIGIIWDSQIEKSNLE
jgi:hypothetical protein